VSCLIPRYVVLLPVCSLFDPVSSYVDLSRKANLGPIQICPTGLPVSSTEYVPISILIRAYGSREGGYNSPISVRVYVIEVRGIKGINNIRLTI